MFECCWALLAIQIRLVQTETLLAIEIRTEVAMTRAPHLIHVTLGNARLLCRQASESRQCTKSNRHHLQSPVRTSTFPVRGTGPDTHVTSSARLPILAAVFACKFTGCATHVRVSDRTHRWPNVGVQRVLCLHFVRTGGICCALLRIATVGTSRPVALRFAVRWFAIRAGVEIPACLRAFHHLLLRVRLCW